KTGTAAIPNTGAGIAMAYAVTNSTFGGTTAAAANLVSGNTGRGILVSNSIGVSNMTGNVWEGNLIGTDVTGRLPLGNGGFGIDVGCHGNLIGGPGAGAGNVIAGNVQGGINIESGDGLVIQGNFIGTDASGTLPLGNHGVGIAVNSNAITIGGIN